MKTKTRWLLLMVIVLSIALTACGPKESGTSTGTQSTTSSSETKTTPVTDDTPEEERYGGVMKLNFSAATNSLDPAQFYTNQNYTPGYHIFESPLSVDETGKIWPGVCTYELSEDGLTLTLKARENVKFHNGDTMDIEDVVASIERFVSLSTMGQDSFGKHIAETNVLDPMTVEYKLKEVAPMMLLIIGELKGGCKVMPAEIAKEAGTEYITDEAKAIGTGPYKVKEWKRDISLTLERFADYVAYDSGGTGPAAPKKAYFDELFFNVATDQMTRTTGMIAGEYDYTTSIVPDMVSQLEGADCWYDVNWNGWSPTLYFNLSENRADSIVANVDFRKAVQACMDMEQIMIANKSTPEFYKLNGSIVPKESIYYNTVLESTYNMKDVEKAKEYLEASGYNGETIIWICSESDSYYKTSLPASEMLKAIGVNVDLQVVDPATYEGMFVDPTADFDICARENQKPIFNPLMSDRYVSGNNTGWWESPARTQALEKLYSTISGSEESLAAFEEFSQAVKDEVPYLICGEFGTQCFYSKNVVPDRQGIDVYWWNSYFKAQ